MASTHLSTPAQDAPSRNLTALSRDEQIVVWTLRHARAKPEARADRRHEWAIRVRGFAPAAAAAGEALVAALGSRRAPAPLAARHTTTVEEAIVEALAAVHANAPWRFCAACESLGARVQDELAGALAIFAGTIEAGGVRLDSPGGAFVMPDAAAAQWLQ
ncbi:MAG: hypothetical protein NBV67_07330 [Tagaea sp.]|nr:hypothetical protein [Tagaea sp.]